MSSRPLFVRTLLFLIAAVIFCASCRSRKPPYSAAEALRTFRLPEGFRAELVAAEPNVADPVAMTFDEQGRLFVVEMPEYPMEAQPLGKIKVLEDLDGDGRFERSTVFAEGLHFPNGVLAWKEGILVTCAPDIIYFADTNGDKRADVRRVILSGFAATNPQLRMNGLQHGIDNWIYGVYLKTWLPRRFVKEFGDMGKPIHFPEHPEVPAVDILAQGMDFRFKPDQLKLEAVAGNSQFGNTFDAQGNRFTVFNNDHIRHVVIQNQYLVRNPFLGVKSAMPSISDHEKAATVYPVTEKPTYIHDSEIGHFTSACGICAYTGGNFPEAYQRSFFVCEPVHNLVHCDLLSPQGATFAARRALQQAEFLASKDSWFHPVFTTVGPDGALYVVDYYRKLVEHPEYVPTEMINRPDMREGHGRGRIYRIVHQTSKSAPRPRLKDASTSELVRQLSNPNMWWRITAQRLLVEHQDLSAANKLRDLARQASTAEGRLHALWTLEGLNALPVDLLLQALGDPSPAVREQAIRLAEKNLTESKLRDQLLQMAGDPDDRVQFQLACTLGLLPASQSFEPLRQIALRHLEDSWFQIAVLTSAAENANHWLKAMIQHQSFTEEKSKGKEEFLRRIASIIGARQREPEMSVAIQALAKGERGQGAWWQAASLDGLADGLTRGSESKMKLSSPLQRTLIQLTEALAPETRTAALNVAACVRLADSEQLQRAIRRATEVCRSPEADLESRVHAARLLGLDPRGSTIPVLGELLIPTQPLQVQLAAARGLANLPNPKTAEILLSGWAAYSTSVKEAVLDGFFKRPAQLPILLDAIEQEKIQAWSLSRSRRTQLTKSADEQIRKRAEALFANLPDDRKPVIDKYRPAVRVSGNPERGREIFSKKCSKCHKMGDLGFEVGPNLVSLSNRNKMDLMTQILDPSANITPGYEEYWVDTKDGRSINGVMVNESATAVTLRQGGGEEHTILRSNIANLRASTVSMMPDGLEEDISVQNMTDLLEFLKSLGGKSAMVQTQAHTQN